jgi:hypothetical protein
MPAWIWIGLVAIILFLVLRSRLAPSIGSLATQAAKTGDLAPLLEGLEKKSPSAQPTAFNEAIRTLWNAHERRPALELIKELAVRHRDAKITQYWLGQALTIEPEIAVKVYSRTFVAEHYQPEVAAQCGPAG